MKSDMKNVAVPTSKKSDESKLHPNVGNNLTLSSKFAAKVVSSWSFYLFLTFPIRRKLSRQLSNPVIEHLFLIL